MAKKSSTPSDAVKKVEEQLISLISSCKARNVDRHLALMGMESTSTIVFEFPDGQSPVPLSPSHISCCLTPPDKRQPIKCRVNESTQSGQYKVVFTPITRGLHQLHVRVHDIIIPGSPLSIPVSISPKMRGPNPVKIITGFFKYPWGIDVTDDGLIIVCEYRSHCITVLDREGKKINSFGSAGSDRGQFNSPCGIAVTSKGTILVVDPYNQRIQELTMKGECIACVGERGNGPHQYEHLRGITMMEGEYGIERANGPLQFGCPRGIAINKTTGQVYVTDEFSHQIQVLNPDLTFSYILGSNGSGKGEFSEPSDVTLDSKGFIYVADTSNHRIQKFTPEGKFVDMFGTKGPKPGQLRHPSGITVDDNDLLYVTESINHRVSIFNTNGKFIHCFGECDNKMDWFLNPQQVSLDKFGYLYVCDYENSRVIVY